MVLQKVVPIVEIALNGAEDQTTKYPVSMICENDGHYIVWSYLNTKTALQQLQQTYLKAFPAKKIRPAPPQSRRGTPSPSSSTTTTPTPVRIVQSDGASYNMLLSISKFLQQVSWPLCKAEVHCRRPNDWHRPDIAILMMESNESIPERPPTPPASDDGIDAAYLELPPDAGYDAPIPTPRRISSPRLVGLPIVLFEVEGSKDVWGRNEQESKAMHEVTSSLAMLPVVYLIFMYPREIKIWEAKRNPPEACIDIKEEIITISDKGKGVGTYFWELVMTIVRMMIKQVTEHGPVVEASMKYMRAHELHECARPSVINVGPTDEICTDCYRLESIEKALNLSTPSRTRSAQADVGSPCPRKGAHGRLPCSGSSCPFRKWGGGRHGVNKL